MIVRSTMNILFLTQILPYPLDAGPKTRAYYVLRYLAEAGHRVTLLSFVRANDRPEYLAHLRDYCHAIDTVPIRRSRRQDVADLMRSLPSNKPFLIGRDWIPAMATQVQHHLTQGNHPIDAVHADQLWMAPYAQWARQVQGADRLSSSGKVRLVLDQHNAVFQIPRRLAEHERNPIKRSLLGLEARKMARYEVEVCRQFDEVIWVTQEDRDAVEAQSTAVTTGPSESTDPHIPVTTHHSVIPICIDPDQQPAVQRSADAHRVTFLGGLHWPPNAEGIVWFVRAVWPLIRQQAPNAVLTVIGKDPPAELQDTVLQNLDVTGYVDDPMPYLKKTAVFIVPLHAGGGMRVKILDAWRWGLPVVSSTIGAEGIAVENGENALLADTPEAFAQAVTSVLQNRTVADALAAKGRQTVETRYNWRTVYRAWNAVYR